MNQINRYLERDMDTLNSDEEKAIVKSLTKQMQIEFRKQDKSGIYGATQYKMAYNSNRIEGSTLTEKQTVSLFETGTLPVSEDIYKSKDIEEMNGHFLMFNEMIKSYDETLTDTLIKRYHYSLKNGVFEDKANGYPVGEYKNRVNRVSDIVTCPPDQVESSMKELLDEYNKLEIHDILDIVRFHAKYEMIHPFQDGNGRTGRIIMFKESLKNGVIPFIVPDDQKVKYINSLDIAHKEENYENLLKFVKDNQKEYYKEICKYLYVYEKKKDKTK